MNLNDVYQLFPTKKSCLDYLEKIRWSGNPQCPYCKSYSHSTLSKESRYHCNTCNTSYSVLVGTFFQNTKVDLQKWFLAVILILNAKENISSRQLADEIKINKNSAWYIGTRINKAVLEKSELLNNFLSLGPEIRQLSNITDSK
jgi:transposase-like protein